MVYECLTVSTKHIRLLPIESGFRISKQATDLFDSQPAITVRLQFLPVQILSTCQLVYSEALPFLSPKLDRIRENIPRISVDVDCLYTSALSGTQKLLCAVLDDLNRHPFFDPKPSAISIPRNGVDSQLLCSRELNQWLQQTTHLLLSQRPAPCPFSGFMGTSTYPAVRMVIEVPMIWRYNTWQGHAVGPHAHVGAEPTHTKSITTQLSQVWNGLVDHTRQLEHVKSGAILFGQEDEKVLTKDGLIMKKTVALDFSICRIAE